MKTRPPKNQSGFALIMFMLVLIGAGGLLLVEYTEGMQNAFDSKKFEHNRRVLEEAKRALLQSAYNYPVTNGLGPGRLPCADTDNDGIANCGSTFGRLPWNQPNLNLYDIRDADNERLWYAVSSSFRPQAAIINSGTPGSTNLSSGTITLKDQEGHVIFDGSNPGDLARYGIAALIIAPGAPIPRNGVKQDRSIANADDPFDTLADTDPGIITPENYLDLAAGEDNAGFINSSDTDGLILGPDNQIINDQFIIITATEVVEMAEQATLQAYRDAIKDFRVKTSYCEGESPDGATTEAFCVAASGIWTLGHYPWLYNYTGVLDIAGLSSYFPANSNWATEKSDNLSNYGRIPATFGEYFTETNSQPVDSGLSGWIGIKIPRDIVCSDCDDEFTHGSDNFRFNNYLTLKTPVFQQEQILTDVKFVHIGLPTGKDGRLTGNSATAVSGTLEMYFWDDKDDPTEIFTPCGDDGNGIPEVTDCNRDSSGTPKPGGENEEDSIILYIQVSLDFPYSAGAVSIDMNYSVDPVITMVPTSANSHAVVSATFANNTGIINGTMPTISGGSFKIDAHYDEEDTYLFEDEPMADSGGINSSTFVVEGPLNLGIRYYPELPEWVFTNEWHNSVRMAYANDYRPDTLSGPCSANVDCLRMTDIDGNHHNKVSLLVIAGEHDWDDEDSDGMSDEIQDVFDDGNHNDNLTFYLRKGNDKILIVEEL